MRIIMERGSSRGRHDRRLNVFFAVGLGFLYLDRFGAGKEGEEMRRKDVGKSVMA